jgi:LTXXQ motif family protein
MWKAIVVGTAVLFLLGTPVVHADHRGGFDSGRRSQPNMEDLRAFSEARLAALRAGLVLNAEQEKNWPAFEQAARELGSLRLDRISAMRDAAAVPEPAERLRQRATAMAATAAALQKLAEATDPLYKSLDENQKRRFLVLQRLSGPRMDHFHGRDGLGPRHHHWGPRRTDHGPNHLEHSGEQRL